jgi:RimJ/RimL family protein N-acetyltransferase
MSSPTLRQWKESDFEHFAAMNADPDVMRYFLAALTRSESLEMFGRLRTTIDQRGWGVWAVEVDGSLAGMVGLHIPKYQLPFSPCTEVLWRLRKEFWGRGIGHSAAMQAMEYGFSKVGLTEIVAFTTPPNHRSIRLMARLGLERDHQGDFDHPVVPEGHPLRRHILFRKQTPNKALEPTTMAVTSRAPSSTRRASHGRGSS